VVSPRIPFAPWVVSPLFPFVLDRFAPIPVRRVNTVNRYIGKSIIARKPITRCYPWTSLTVTTSKIRIIAMVFSIFHFSTFVVSKMASSVFVWSNNKADIRAGNEYKTRKWLVFRAVENHRTYRTVGQKLTRSDLPSQKKILPKIKKNKIKNNRNFRKIDARPSGIGYTFSSQTLQCEVKIWLYRQK
jgi:hypothetical protein